LFGQGLVGDKLLSTHTSKQQLLQQISLVPKSDENKSHQQKWDFQAQKLENHP